MRTPPRLGKHQGFMVTSASRAGSQNPTEIPMRGNGSAQAQIGEAGLFVSGRPLGQIFRPPTERGNRQDQQTSVIGFTNLPLQVGPAAWALRSEEHTSELQSLMRSSYAVLCFEKKKNKT